MTKSNTYEVKFWNHILGIPPYKKRKTKEWVRYQLEDLPDNLVTVRVVASSPGEAVHKIRNSKMQKHMPFRLSKIRIIIHENNAFA